MPRPLATGAAVLLAALAAQAAPAAQAATQAAPLDSRLGLQKPEVGAALNALSGHTGSVLGPLQDLRLDPWANSAADPLNNGVGLAPSHPGDHPISTKPLTSPLSQGGGLSKLPVVGTLTSALGH